MSEHGHDEKSQIPGSPRGFVSLLCFSSVGTGPGHTDALSPGSWALQGQVTTHEEPGAITAFSC